VVCHDGLARAVRPAHTPSDGDIVFTLATGELPIEHSDYRALEAIAALRGAARDYCAVCCARRASVGVRLCRISQRPCGGREGNSSLSPFRHNRVILEKDPSAAEWQPRAAAVRTSAFHLCRTQ
jgi:hypothetical protein